MIDKVTRALLGDVEAQHLLTENETLLPCHCRNSKPELIKYNGFECQGSIFKNEDPHYVICRGCGSSTAVHRIKKNAIRDWNTRQPLLNKNQIDLL